MDSVTEESTCTCKVQVCILQRAKSTNYEHVNTDQMRAHMQSLRCAMKLKYKIMLPGNFATASPSYFYHPYQIGHDQNCAHQVTMVK